MCPIGYTAAPSARTVHLTSTDAAAILGADATLTSGTRNFTVTFSEGGDHTLTATDTVAPSVTGTSGVICVSAAADLAITLTNLGASTATDVEIETELPPGTTFVSLSAPAGWTSTTPVVDAGGSITLTRAAMAPGSVQFTITAKVGYLVNCATLTPFATASSTTTDLVPGNNTDEDTVTVSAASRIALRDGATATGPQLFNNQLPIPGFRVRVTSGLTGGITLRNSTGPAGENQPYVDVITRLQPGAQVTVLLQFHSPSCDFTSFSPTIVAEPLPAGITDLCTGPGVLVTLDRQPDGSYLVEFRSVKDRFYIAEYSDDLITWKQSLVPLKADNPVLQWVDRGPPFTDAHPSTRP